MSVLLIPFGTSWSRWYHFFCSNPGLTGPPGDGELLLALAFLLWRYRGNFYLLWLSFLLWRAIGDTFGLNFLLALAFLLGRYRGLYLLWLALWGYPSPEFPVSPRWRNLLVS